MAAEKDLEALLRRSLGVHFHRRHRVRKHHADQFTGAGHPDFYGHILGKYVEFELKVKPNRPTPAQLTQLIESAMTGAYAFLLIEDGAVCWLIPALVLGGGFSYKDKQGWLPLPFMDYRDEGGKARCIDLQPLRLFIS